MTGLAKDALYLRCEETETIEHLRYGCENYSAKNTGDYIPNIDITSLEIVFNKPPPSILLHAKGNTTRKVLLSSRSQT